MAPPKGARLSEEPLPPQGARPYSPPPPPSVYDPAEGLSNSEKLLIGAGAATDKAWRGVKKLVGVDTSQEDEDAKLYQKHHPGGWATAGEVAADVAMSAIPVARGGQVLTKALSKVPLVSRAAPAVADVAANAAYSAATAPEDRDTAALWGGGGAAAGRVLNRAVSGVVHPTAHAEELLRQGVRLTPGQAGGREGVGALADIYERGLEAVPGIGRTVTRARERGLEDWNRVMLDQARPAQAAAIDRSAPVGQRGIERAKGELGEGYRALFPEGTTLRLDADTADVYDAVTERLAKGVAPSGRGKFEEVAAWVGQHVKDGVDAPLWKEAVEAELDAAKKAALRDGHRSLFKALDELDRQLSEALPYFEGMSPQADAIKRTLDRGYFNAKTLEGASSKAGPTKRGGVMYPSEVAVAAAKRGNRPVLEKALAAQQTFGSAPTALDKLGNIAKAGAVGVVGHGVAGGAAVPAAVVSLLGTTEAGRRLLLGQTTWQEFARAHPEIASQVARAMATQE